MKITLPLWYDLHAHIRQGEPMGAYINAHKTMGCAGLLAMPNTKPPVGKIFKKDPLPYWSIEEYRDQIMDAGGDEFLAIIIPLYLTGDTTPQKIADGAKGGHLKACKYYPPHGTTNADFGRPLETFIENGVFAAMEENGIILCLHGEMHGLSGAQYFDRSQSAEDFFYQEKMPKLREKFPDLKIVCEHITTKTAVDFVKTAGSLTAATITPQHLLYTVGDLLMGLKYHLYCLPLVKFDEDRGALREAVNNTNNQSFFAGTDSAPHTTKVTECGCAAGCFTGGYAPQLYAESFDLNKGHDAFVQFLCKNGPRFYNLPVPEKTFELSLDASEVHPLVTAEGIVTPLPLGMGSTHLKWKILL